MRVETAHEPLEELIGPGCEPDFLGELVGGQRLGQAEGAIWQPERIVDTHIQCREVVDQARAVSLVTGDRGERRGPEIVIDRGAGKFEVLVEGLGELAMLAETAVGLTAGEGVVSGGLTTARDFLDEASQPDGERVGGSKEEIKTPPIHVGTIDSVLIQGDVVDIASRSE